MSRGFCLTWTLWTTLYRITVPSNWAVSRVPHKSSRCLTLFGLFDSWGLIHGSLQSSQPRELLGDVVKGVFCLFASLSCWSPAALLYIAGQQAVIRVGCCTLEISLAPSEWSPPPHAVPTSLAQTVAKLQPAAVWALNWLVWRAQTCADMHLDLTLGPFQLYQHYGFSCFYLFWHAYANVVLYLFPNVES